jgi:16S rRNA (guanine1207-N2)-methyltransferase
VGSSQYFTPAPGSPSRPRAAVLALPDVTLTLVTDRGVFAHGAVDAGTRYLLLEGPRPPAAGDVLDLGCGYGPVALTLASRAPHVTVWAVDVNQRALDLCAANARDAGLGNVRVCLPEDVPGSVRFGGLWSNPPIRIGKEAMHGLLQRWLVRLAPGASATLVAHKHLGADSLARWLVGEGWSVQRLGSRAGYRLLAVTAAPAAGEP